MQQASHCIFTRIHSRYNSHVGTTNSDLKHSSEAQHDCRRTVVVWNLPYSVILNSDLKFRTYSWKGLKASCSCFNLLIKAVILMYMTKLFCYTFTPPYCPGKHLNYLVPMQTFNKFTFAWQALVFPLITGQRSFSHFPSHCLNLLRFPGSQKHFPSQHVLVRSLIFSIFLPVL